MIFNTKATQKDASQKLTDFSVGNNKSNELWHELNETSEAAVSGGSSTILLPVKNSETIIYSKFINNKGVAGGSISFL
jgi:hypothetical protein